MNKSLANILQRTLGVMKDIGVLGFEPTKIDAPLIDAAKCRKIAQRNHEEIQRQFIAIPKRLDRAHRVIKTRKTVGNVFSFDDKTIVVENGRVLILVVVKNEAFDRLTEQFAVICASHSTRAILGDGLLLPILENFAMNSGKQLCQIGDTLGLIMGNRSFRLFLEGREQSPTMDDGQSVPQLLELTSADYEFLGGGLHATRKLGLSIDALKRVIDPPCLCPWNESSGKALAAQNSLHGDLIILSVFSLNCENSTPFR